MKSFPFDSYKFAHEPSTLKLKIADFVVQLNSTDKALIDALGEQYHKFLTKEDRIFLMIDIHLSKGIHFPDNQGNDNLYVNQRYDGNTCYVRSNYFIGYVNFETGIAGMVINEANPLSWLEHFLRVAFAVVALQNKSTVFHAAGIIENEEGYIFFGPSGVGKTTVTNLSKPRFVLGDDLLVLQQNNGSANVSACPFNSEKNGFQLTNTKVPVKACFRLVQDTRTYLQEMKPVNAVFELLNSVRPLSNHSIGSETALEFCTRLADRVPCYELHFTKDNTFWRTIHELS